MKYIKIMFYLFPVAIATTCVSWARPKKELGSVVLFSMSKKEYSSGNISALLDYYDNFEHAGTHYVIYRDKKYVKQIKYSKRIRIGSWKYYKLVLLSKAIVCDGNPVCYGPFGFLIKLSRLNVVQVWHGTGFKNILLESGSKSSLVDFFRDKEYSSYALVIAGSESDKKRKIKAFNNKNVKITGNPKTDMLFADPVLNRKNYAEDEQILILYAPTFRKYDVITPSFLTGLNEYLIKKNHILILKRHPSDISVELSGQYSNLIDVTGCRISSDYFLPISDILITDYSSLSVDYCLLNRPIISYIPDYERYMRERHGMYYDIMELLPGPFCYDLEQLKRAIGNIDCYRNSSGYIDKYREFRRMFHEYTDGKSCERICYQINNL